MREKDRELRRRRKRRQERLKQRRHKQGIVLAAVQLAEDLPPDREWEADELRGEDPFADLTCPARHRLREPECQKVCSVGIERG